MTTPRSPRTYRVYGLALRSPWPLPCPEGRGSALADVELLDGSPSCFREARRAVPNRGDWFDYRRLADGSEYARWSGLFEFLISPGGHRIACHALDGASREAFTTYLLGQVLSFALLDRGIEPLHATAVVIGGRAAAFLSGPGSGKSTLGAAFLQAGHALLTDDLLVARPEGRRIVAYPGPRRIKLFPGVARRLFGERVAGIPMNPLTRKLVIPLVPAGARAASGATPLRAIYVLRSPDPRRRVRRITIRPLAPRQACLALLRNTFNSIVLDPARLRRQLDLAARLTRTIPVRSLSFPRELAALPAVREAIEADLVT
ncbi:MAG: hypothetical protein HY002_01190 [Candidatus Rokubacteria bacterium]|nr:hypothetical protein [Candidatus Rokubacteria bacterium]